MAKEETIILIQRVLDGDPTITPQEKEQILKACRNRARRMVISAKEAMRILGISRPTLRAYVHQGLLTQINVSARKVRFAQDEVEQLAGYGRKTNEVETC